MNSLEKNDVDISKLFEWSGEFTIQDRFGNDALDVHIRLLGDADVNRARVYGLRKSAELRKKLRKENSDERLAYIPDKDQVEKDVVVESIVLFTTRDLTMEAIRTLPPQTPKEPSSDAGLEEQEKYQEEVDNFPAKREKEIHKHISKTVDKKRQELLSKDMDEVFKEYESMLINQICETEMLHKFREMCVYLGTYKDHNFKKRLFKSIEVFDNLPKTVKSQLVDYYISLELGGEDLKKLQGATQ